MKHSSRAAASSSAVDRMVSYLRKQIKPMAAAHHIQRTRGTHWVSTLADLESDCSATKNAARRNIKTARDELVAEYLASHGFRGKA